MPNLPLRPILRLTLGLSITAACAPDQPADTDAATTATTTTATTTTDVDPTDATPTTTTSATDPGSSSTTAAPQCQSNADCLDPCFDCVDGVCVGAPLCEDPHGECRTDEDCDEGESCSGETCVPLQEILPPCPPAAVEVGLTPIEEPISALALLRLDGDELVDLVYALPGAGVVEVALNEGMGEYLGADTVPIGGETTQLSLASGDLDQDGDLDLVVARDGDAPGLVVLTGQNGDFMAGPVQPGAPGAHSVFVTDVDGDDAPDVLTLYAGAPHVTVRLGDGKGGLADEQPAGVDEAPGAQATVAPLLMLGGDDLLVPFPEAQELRLLSSQADATFVALRAFTTVAPAFAALAADLDLDGLPEVVSVMPGRVEVWKGSEPGVWAAEPTPFSTFEPLQGGVLAEHDGQPGLDLVASSAGDASIVVLRGDGLGGFACQDPLTAAPALPRQLAVGDIDGDGDSDIVTGSSDGLITTLRAK